MIRYNSFAASNHAVYNKIELLVDCLVLSCELYRRGESRDKREERIKERERANPNTANQSREGREKFQANKVARC